MTDSKLIGDLVAVADGVREADANCCKVCGKHYDACKYPVSHSHPTIDNIEFDETDDGTKIDFNFESE